MLKETIEILNQSFYLRVAIGAAIVFGWFNWWLLSQTTTLSDFFRMGWGGDFFSSFNLPLAQILSISYTIFYWLLTVAIIVVFGIAVALLVWLYRNSPSAKLKATGTSLGGTILAMFSSGCLVCGAFLFSLIGMSSGLALFPFKGLELKVLSFGLLAGSVIFTSKKITSLKEAATCENCQPTQALVSRSKSSSIISVLIWIVIILLAVNQLIIGSMIPKTTVAKGTLSKITALFAPQAETKREIIAPLLNPDGRTTSLVKQPTITEVPAEPKGLDPVEVAKVVMLPKGTPFYAPAGISFDDPVGALKNWQPYEKSIQLSPELEARYQKIISTMTCDYCCGSPTRVATINRCGCAHAAASRAIAKYLLQNFGDKYSDEEISGEIRLWQNLWYPRGRIEDYLLATGRGHILGHQTHGGAGADGRHGL